MPVTAGKVSCAAALVKAKSIEVDGFCRKRAVSACGVRISWPRVNIGGAGSRGVPWSLGRLWLLPLRLGGAGCVRALAPLPCPLPGLVLLVSDIRMPACAWSVASSLSRRCSSSRPYPARSPGFFLSLYSQTAALRLHHPHDGRARSHFTCVVGQRRFDRCRRVTTTGRPGLPCAACIARIWGARCQHGVVDEDGDGATWVFGGRRPEQVKNRR